LYRHQADDIGTQLTGEGQLLELISTGAPLSLVLDKISTAFDLVVGNVVSVVLFPEDEEHCTHLIAESAALFGLSIFCCAAVLSPRGELLGTFEVYSCILRSPTPSESRLLERATQLAALAIESHNHDRDSDSFPSRWKRTMEESSRERPPD
jgi:GAF domain-containing protein